MIPRKIHQIWMQGKLSIPFKYKDAQESWGKLHPNYNVIVWDEQDMENLCKGTYWTELIAMCSSLIQRADIYRCAVLERHGGVYVDMDMHALRSIEPLLKELEVLDSDIAVGETSFRHTPFNALLGVNNAFISAKQHSVFWKKIYYPHVLKSLHAFTVLDMMSPLYNVLHTAGPGAWTHISTSEMVHVLPQEYFYSLKKVKKTKVSKEDSELLSLSYAYHAQDSTWLTSWESFIIQAFIGNNWKITITLFLFIFLIQYL
jgi:mannosyltransferase OCH1-like enzyme